MVTFSALPSGQGLTTARGTRCACPAEGAQAKTQLLAQAAKGECGQGGSAVARSGVVVTAALGQASG